MSTKEGEENILRALMYRVRNLSLAIKSLISRRTATSPPVAPAMMILPEDMSEVICEVNAGSNRFYALQGLPIMNSASISQLGCDASLFPLECCDSKPIYKQHSFGSCARSAQPLAGRTSDSELADAILLLDDSSSACAAVCLKSYVR